MVIQDAEGVGLDKKVWLDAVPSGNFLTFSAHIGGGGQTTILRSLVIAPFHNRGLSPLYCRAGLGGNANQLNSTAVGAKLARDCGKPAATILATRPISRASFAPTGFTPD